MTTTMAKKKTNKASKGKSKATEKTILHVGCNVSTNVPADFKDYKQIRLDIDADAKPDIVSDIRDMNVVDTGSHDAVFSSHNIEHLYRHEVPQALGEMYRVLKGGGQLIITMPDVQRVAEHVAQGNLEEKPLFNSPMGPIFAVDILYGHTEQIKGGNEYWAHKTSFTAKSLGNKLMAAGFYNILIVREGFNLWARAFKPEEGQLINEARYMTLDTASYPFGPKVYEVGFEGQAQTVLKDAIDKTLEKSGIDNLYS